MKNLLSAEVKKIKTCNFLQLAKETAASTSTPARFSVRRKPSTPVKENPYQNGGSFIEPDENFYDDDFLDDFEETFEDSHYENDNLSIPSSEHSRNYPVTCIVIYPYEVIFQICYFKSFA